ncbi:MAG: DinB family protein [Candidatus Zixiibacteriota bacterium]|nr:MAG: DinB family protein [candidate division Zixibacteria bacterium]
MVQRTSWIQRKFNFDFPVGLLPCILERLRGTPVRLEAIINQLPPDILIKKPESGWSIQENVGHLTQVEGLFDGRLDDFDAGVEVLRPAEMKNIRTSEANYNAMEIKDVLAEFRSVRESFVSRFEKMDEAAAGRSAQHPRLEIPMRVVDNAFFAAEHDDYHLAVITELVRKLA